MATQVADNLTMTAQSKLARSITFRRVAVLELLKDLIASVVAVWLAWRGAGLWSLVSSDIVAAVVLLVGFYGIRPVWRPRFGWSREVAAYLFDFGRRSFAAIALLQALDRVDDIWTGAVLGDTALGYYSRAYTFATYPRKLLAAPLNRVASSTYAALKEDPKRLSQAFFRVNAFLIRSGFFFAGLLFLLVPEFIHLVIGEKWLPMMVPFRLMLVYTLLDPIKITIGNVFIALGQPEKVVRARFWQLVVMVIGLFTLGPWLGINGVALAVDVMLIFGITQLLWQVREHVQFSAKALFAAPAVALGVSAAVGAALMLIPVMGSSYWLSGSVKAVVFTALYAATLFTLERDRLWMLFEVLLQLRGKGKMRDDQAMPRDES